jgi:hypothetical protein
MENNSKGNKIIDFAPWFHERVEDSIEKLMYNITDARRSKYFLLLNIKEFLTNIMKGRGTDIRWIDPYYWNILVYYSINDKNMSVKISNELHDIFENAYYVTDEELYKQIMTLISDTDAIYKSIQNGYKCDEETLDNLYYKAAFLNNALKEVKSAKQNKDYRK